MTRSRVAKKSCGLGIVTMGVFVVGAVASSGWAMTFDQLIIFGDSLSDTGNVFTITGRTAPQPPYFNGRFSNGPVWVERFAERLGVPMPTASLLGGGNYAYGGADTGFGTSVRGTPNISEQVSAYLAGLGSATAGRNDLFVVWGGSNDFANAPLRGVSVADTVPLDSVTNLANDIVRLANKGAEQFMVPNLVPLGQTPGFRGTSDEAVLDAKVEEFNALLDVALDEIESTLNNVTVFRYDVFGLFGEIASVPINFGLTNLTDRAFSGFLGVPGSVVPNPDEYLFWDWNHPTTVTHEILGQRAFNVVIPEPNTVVFAAIGWVGLCVAARRRQVTV